MDQRRARRLLAAVSLVVLAVTEVAPHRHADSPFEWSQTSEDESGVVHIYRCSGPTPGVSHLHPDQTRAVDPCLACLRQHFRATAASPLVAGPHGLAHFAIAEARVSHARAAGDHCSSRAPPAFFS